MQHLKLNPEEFSQKFPHRPFTIRHELAAHPLFALPRLIELSQQLPESFVEYNAGNLPIGIDPKQTPRNGLSIKDTIQRIEECRSWLVLKDVEQVPEYKALLDECLDQVRELSDGIIPGMEQREGFIFITSPGSVTPYHTDPEHNFLLQVRGNKTVHMFDGKDRSIISEEELEAFHSGGHRNLKFKDEYQSKARSFTLQPGDGLHFPVNDPHWVKNGEEVSISFSITFRSPVSKRNARLYFANNQLRKMGIPPTPPGRSAWRDVTKDLAFVAARRLARAVGGGAASQGRKY